VVETSLSQMAAAYWSRIHCACAAADSLSCRVNNIMIANSRGTAAVARVMRTSP